MLERLPTGVGVLGTTATANDRVVADVEEQLRRRRRRVQDLPRAARPLEPALRGRRAARPGGPARLARAPGCEQLPGSGIVYTLTKRDAEHGRRVAERPRASPPRRTAGEIETERRSAVEDRLLRNDLKAVVATSALGMGYDKPDLGFVVHYQAPGSVISYYQQVGRAGRAIERAEVVLLRGTEDRRIQDFFIEQAFPRRERGRARARQLEARGERGRDDRGADRRRSTSAAAASRRC